MFSKIINTYKAGADLIKKIKIGSKDIKECNTGCPFLTVNNTHMWYCSLFSEEVEKGISTTRCKQCQKVK